MNGAAIAKQEQHQRSTLKDELNRLSGQIEAAKRRLETYKVDQAEYDKLLKLLEGLRAQRDALREELRFLERRQRKADADLKKTERKLATASERLAAIEGSDKPAAHKALAAEVERLTGERDALVGAARSGHKEEISDIAKDTAEARRVLASLNTAVGKARKDLSSMSADQKKHKQLLADIEAAHDSLDELGRTIKARETEQKKADQKLADTRAQIEQERKDFDAECHKKDVALKLRGKDLDDREGEVGRQVQWTKERTGKLRQAKTEIENFHGKVLKHIIIPED